MSGTRKDTLVVVTGGAGFIGSHTVGRLLDDGCQVVVLDNFSTGKLENLAQWRDDPRLEVVEVNIADGIFAPLAEVTKRRGPVERIIHLAAQVSVTASVANPLDDARVNYGATIHVMEYARRCQVKKVVFASSAAIYGDVDTLPVAEEQPCRPLSPYGIHKYTSELFLGYNSAVFSIPTTPLRFFNVYGPRQDPKSPYTGVISIFADRATAGSTLTIFGDGEQTRDFIYVGDIAHALVTACASDDGDGTGINLGTGKETTINELARVIVSLCESKSAIAHGDPREGEILRSVARVEKARTDLGFEAQVELVDGLRKTLEWMRTQ